MLKELKYVLKAENNISRLFAIAIIYAIIWGALAGITLYLSKSIIISIAIATPICILSLWRELRNPLFTEHGVYAYISDSVMYPKSLTVYECGSGYKCYYSTDKLSITQTVNNLEDVNELKARIVEREWQLYH